MKILGINAYHADASAALLINGQLIVATEEERFTRTKHWAGFPVQAIAFCLKEAQLNLADIDYIAIGRDPKAKLFKKLRFTLSSPIHAFRYALTRLKNAKQVSSIEEILMQVDTSCTLENLKKKIVQVEHHRAHLASAFYPSPYEQAAVLSIDGAGDFSTTMLGIAKVHP